MRRSLKLALVLLGAVTIAVPVWLGRPSRIEQVAPPPSAHLEPESEPRSEVLEPAEPPVTARPPADPRAGEHLERLDFHDRMRSFFEQAMSMPDAARGAQARALAKELSRYEAAGEVAAAEALLVRTELIRAAVDEPQEQMAQIEALHAQYREDGERRQAEWEARTDPQFDDYKARERRIVDEVMAMTEFPGDLGRDEYLRRRLQEARQRAHRPSGD